MSEGKKDWKGDYEKLMKQCGFTVQIGGKADNRRHPRLAFRTGTSISVETDATPCQIVNISVGGISFYADVQFPDGQPVTISLEGGLTQTLQVDSFHVEELPPVMLVTPHKYIIGARFLSEEDGYRMMAEVLRKEGDSLFELPTA